MKSITSKHRIGKSVLNMDTFHGVVLAAAVKSRISLFTKNKLEYLRNKKNETEEKKPLSHHIMEVIEAPYLWALYVTCLPAMKEQYSRLRCIIYPIPGFFFAWFIVHPDLDETYLYYVLPVGVLCTLIMWLVLPKDGSYPKWGMVLTILAVISGLMWSYLLILILIDLLNAVGMLLNLEPSYLGLSVLAIGNALPDAFTTIALTAQGHAAMAISGGYAGQLFGYLVGFGV